MLYSGVTTSPGGPYDHVRQLSEDAVHQAGPRHTELISLHLLKTEHITSFPVPSVALGDLEA
ncbi:hypothetical protein E2C01_022861 [Portunus trituberculatus]|uniref:Uncharacterized protein n=1 Tax=Portunus trituberculatus TaxID=210409 RepID=A0A5B7E890_PORTR|nr:hypothetical protein [Portunus trituberculatus]